MSVLESLVDALGKGSVEVVDLTAPLSSETPILELPPEFGQTARFTHEEISRYDDRGPAWYWNNFQTGEHTGTHFDAPNHSVTGCDLADVASVAPSAFVAPAVVIDVTNEVNADPALPDRAIAPRRLPGRAWQLPGGWLAAVPHWLVVATNPRKRCSTTPMSGPPAPG